MSTNSIENLLWHALAIFLLIGAVSGIALGLLLVFNSPWLQRINLIANRWISMRHIGLWLDRSISIERWFYRHHRVMGVFVMLGALYILLYFGLMYDRVLSLERLARYMPASLVEILLEALVYTSLIGGVISLLAGCIIFLRPSLLRGIEKGANQWVTSRNVTKLLDVPHSHVDLFIAHHAKSVGVLLLLASGYLFFAMFCFLS